MSKSPKKDFNYKEGSRIAPFFHLNSFMRTTLKLAGFFAFASLLIAVSMVSYDYIKTRGAFPPKTYIYTVDVSSLTKGEAERKLKKIPLAELYAPCVSFEAEGKYYSFPPDEAGVYLLIKETVGNAFSMTHQDNYIDELKERISVGAVYAPLILGIDEDQLEKVLEKFAKKIETEPKDAGIVFYEDTGGYHIEPEIPGRKIDIDKTIKRFKASLYQEGGATPVKINYSYPAIKELELRASPPIHKLSAYTTYYGSHDSPNRIHNIKLIASWIDGTLLMPGKEFSVAEILGDVGPEQGFKEAFVIVGGELIPLLGGGACQIATTLYNAVALADLEILQRKNHSFYFNIYPLGRDAGVYPGQVDFKFKNDSGHPLLIKTVATKRKLSFRIYGTPSGKKVRFSGASILGKDGSGKYVPMTLKKVIDLDVPFRTLVTRKVYDKNWRL
ncbi:MAG: VanW family protein, partial [Candidatus Margulisiibacteriota bacterium]|nr:VanW family protein [Candidatus Margulisiibacteriota bacterium]